MELTLFTEEFPSAHFNASCNTLTMPSVKVGMRKVANPEPLSMSFS